MRRLNAVIVFLTCFRFFVADMAALEAEVRAIQKDGLLWGTSKLAPVGFGIKKLQITCVIEDAKVRFSCVEMTVVI